MGIPRRMNPSFLQNQSPWGSRIYAHLYPTLRAEQTRHLYGAIDIKPLPGAFCYAQVRNLIVKNSHVGGVNRN